MERWADDRSHGGKQFLDFVLGQFRMNCSVFTGIDKTAILENSIG